MSEAGSVPVSVVIPCFRCATSIVGAVESIEQQSIKPAEVILVDDSSGDETLVILQDIASKHAGWIKIIELKKNLGAGSARNAGWGVASQPYIAFLDADDSWHPEKLSIQYEYMRNKPEISLCGHYCIQSNYSDTPHVIEKRPSIKRISKYKLLFRSPFNTPSVMLKRDIPFRFKEGKRYSEDLLLLQQIAFSGLQIVRMEATLAYFHKPLYGAAGLSAQLGKMEKGELDNLTAMRKENNIGYLLFSAAYAFSAIKFVKRLVVTKIKGVANLVFHR